MLVLVLVLEVKCWLALREDLTHRSYWSHKACLALSRLCGRRRTLSGSSAHPFIDTPTLPCAPKPLLSATTEASEWSASLPTGPTLRLDRD